jgi:Na+-driven multidrug efflux pump
MGFLVLANIIPQIYILINIFWIGRISTDAFAITEQNVFIELVIEILIATIPVGVLALTAQHYHNREKVCEILKAGLILQAALSLTLMAIIIFFNQELVGMVGTHDSIVSPTREYLLLRSISIPFDMISYTLLITIRSLQKGKEAFLLVTISIIVNILLDLLLISSTPVSLHLGIPGVAIAYIITKMVLTVIAAAYLFPLLGMTIPSFLTTAWRQEVLPLFRIGSWSGLEAVVMMSGSVWILIILNGLGKAEYSGFSIATWIFWILLKPIFAIGKGTSILVGNYSSERRYGDLLDIMKTSLLLVTVFVLAIVTTGFLWWHHVSLVLNPNPEIAVYSFAAFSGLIIGFIGYGMGIVLRSIFYGTGQTRYIFYIGTITNLGIILPFFLLVQAGILQPTFPMVMMVYLIANIVDPILAYLWARRVVSSFAVKKPDEKMPG